MSVYHILSHRRLEEILSSRSHQLGCSRFPLPLLSQACPSSTFETAGLGWYTPLSLSSSVPSPLYCSLFLLTSPVPDLSTHSIPILFKNNYLPAYSRNWLLILSLPFSPLHCCLVIVSIFLDQTQRLYIRSFSVILRVRSCNPHSINPCHQPCHRRTHLRQPIFSPSPLCTTNPSPSSIATARRPNFHCGTWTL